MATKTVIFLNDDQDHIGQCDITDAAYETLAGGDMLISYGGAFYGYHDAAEDWVQLTPRWPHLLFSMGEPGAPAHVVPADPSGDVARLAAVSDLFFNYEHPARDKLVGRYNSNKTNPRANPIPTDEYRAAVAKDAQDFVNTFAIATGITLKVDDVVRDYLDRE